jgi:hypothetical protein
VVEEETEEGEEKAAPPPPPTPIVVLAGPPGGGARELSTALVTVFPDKVRAERWVGRVGEAAAPHFFGLFRPFFSALSATPACPAA